MKSATKERKKSKIFSLDISKAKIITKLTIYCSRMIQVACLVGLGGGVGGVGGWGMEINTSRSH